MSTRKPLKMTTMRMPEALTRRIAFHADIQQRTASAMTRYILADGLDRLDAARKKKGLGENVLD